MKPVEVYIANTNKLICEGINALLANQEKINVVGIASEFNQFSKEMIELQPDVLIIDYTSNEFKLSKIGTLKNLLPNTKFLGITFTNIKYIISQSLEAGFISHILNECDEEEIVDAVLSTARGESFFCGKIIDVVFNDEQYPKNRSGNLCNPIKLSERELEVIKFIAEGYTNKEIADKLFLSNHTITTHRKNILSKLGVNNTAGIVMYAVKQNLASPEVFNFQA